MAEELVEKVRYEADISDLTAKIDQISRKQDELNGNTTATTTGIAGSWNKVNSGIGDTAKKVGLAAAGIAGSIAIIGPAVLSQGAELEALDKKANTVFGGSLGSVQSWAQQNASALGMTRDQLTGVAAGVGDLLKPMGFTAEQAASMSTEMLDLSGALSAWTGGTRSASEVADIMTKAMLGERDGLKELGISISEADVQARLAQNGQDGLTGSALEQAKALATQQLIMEKSTDAQKAWSDGSMDSIKQQNASKASLELLKETLVKAVYPALQKLIPVITSVAQWLGDKIPAVIATARSAWDKLTAAFDWLMDHKPILIGVLTAIGIGIAALFATWLAGAIPAAAATIAAFAPFIAIGVAIAAVVAAVIYAYQNFEIFRTVVDAVGRFFSDVLWPALQDVFGWMKDNIPPLLETIAGWFQTLWDKTEIVRDILVGGFKLAVDGAKLYIDAWWSAVSTLAGWLQTAWDKTEPLRVLLAEGFKLAVDGIKAAIDLLWGAIETAAGWLQTAWDKTDTLRALFVGGLKTALDGARTAWDKLSAPLEAIVGWLDKIITKSDRAVSLLNVLPGVDIGTGTGSAGPTIPKTGGGGGLESHGGSLRGSMHSGGMVPGFTGQESVWKLVAGETVRTREQEAALRERTGGAAPTIHVTVMVPDSAIVVDPGGISDAAAYAIERGLYRVGRGRS